MSEDDGQFGLMPATRETPSESQNSWLCLVSIWTIRPSTSTLDAIAHPFYVKELKYYVVEHSTRLSCFAAAAACRMQSARSTLTSTAALIFHFDYFYASVSDLRIIVWCFRCSTSSSSSRSSSGGGGNNICISISIKHYCIRICGISNLSMLQRDKLGVIDFCVPWRPWMQGCMLCMLQPRGYRATRNVAGSMYYAAVCRPPSSPV